MILVIDHQDSFVHNLARYYQLLGFITVVTDSPTEEQCEQAQVLVFSPGPRAPADYPASIELIKKYDGKKPILGVCLGHQMINLALGGTVSTAYAPLHGAQVSIEHTGESVFTAIPNPTNVGLYHSLAVKTLAPGFRAIAWNGPTIMAIQRGLTVGLQFHPESVLTSAGLQLLANHNKLVGCVNVADTPMRL